MSKGDLEINSEYNNINNDEIINNIYDDYENEDNIISDDNKDIHENINTNEHIENENLEKPVEPEIYHPLTSENANQRESSNKKINNKNNNLNNEENNLNYNNIKDLSQKPKINLNINKNTQKEKYIQDKLLEKFSKNIKNELYEEEYKKVYNKIKNEISFKIREELLSRRQKEIEMKKKKIEYNNKKKLEEYENILYKNIKEEYEMSKIDIINIKTKEFDEKYKKEFLRNKDKIKRDLITKYQIMTNKLIDELEQSKKDLLEQQNKEKMRIKQLNKIQGNYKEQENYQKQRNEQINTMIDNYKHFKMDNRRLDVYPTNNNSKYMNKSNINNKTSKKDRGKSNDIKKIKNNYSMIENEDENNNTKFQFKKTPNKNGVNIKEINNRLKRKYY